jgi:S1-C subfamily serine protease
VDHETGLALLMVEGAALQPAAFGPADAVVPGLPVFIMTCTGQNERKGATGHVTAVGPFEAFWEYMLDRAIMTTVINPGLAGAALLDHEARLIGVVSLGLAAPGRYKPGHPDRAVTCAAARSWKARRARAGRRRAWVGFYPQGFDGGVVITGVVPNGPATAPAWSAATWCCPWTGPRCPPCASCTPRCGGRPRGKR